MDINGKNIYFDNIYISRDNSEMNSLKKSAFIIRVCFGDDILKEDRTIQSSNKTTK